MVASDRAVCRGSGTILVVDDEEMIRTAVSRILTFCGYTVLTARDGSEGLDIYRRQMQDISGIVLDMSMPHMSGRDTFIELKKLNPDVKVLMASGFREDPRVRECMDMGLKLFMQKPFTMNECAAKVDELLHT